jgi:RNA polymerase sigma factor (sigma-70 family)
MAIIEIPQTQQKLNQFAADQWDKTLAYLQGTFAMSRSDCEDIFQEAFIVLYKKIIDGELTLTAKLSTYFIGICRNKAYEKMRGMGRELNIIDEYPNSTKDEYEDDRIDKLLALEDNNEQIEARKEAIVREIVSKLPAPCDKILWGFYRDGFSMKTLATMYNYKSEGSVKVTKHRCGEKFKARFMELSHLLFD